MVDESGVTTIFKGLVVMVVGILFALVCNMGILIPATTIEDGFAQAGVYDLENMDWDTRNDIDTLVTYLHMAIYLMAFLSILYFIICIIRILRYSAQDNEYDAAYAYQGRL